jgi:hypothetical protein
MSPSVDEEEEEEEEAEGEMMDEGAGRVADPFLEDGV